MLSRSSRHRPHLRGLLVSRTDVPKLAEDGSDPFNYLTSYSEQEEYQELLVAPLAVRDGIVRLIEEQAERARRGEPGRITCKMNALTDPRIIESLYEASQAGVRIDLIIRGICCLRPGLEGISENIRVVSLVGRFLEHARAFAFEEGEKEEIYLGSADLIQRNLDRRVEQLSVLREARHRKKVRRFLELQLADTAKAWELKPDGSFARLHPRGGRGTTRQPGAPARRRVLVLATDSPILYISCAYGSRRFQDASFPARGAFRQAVGGVRREGSRRGRVAPPDQARQVRTGALRRRPESVGGFEPWPQTKDRAF
jgi:hypothetical protein